MLLDLPDQLLAGRVQPHARGSQRVGSVELLSQQLDSGAHLIMGTPASRNSDRRRVSTNSPHVTRSGPSRGVAHNRLVAPATPLVTVDPTPSRAGLEAQDPIDLTHAVHGSIQEVGHVVHVDHHGRDLRHVVGLPISVSLLGTVHELEMRPSGQS